MKKRIIILRHNGGRLGNQLLLFASVYAFCLEYGYDCINYTFYNYHNYFENLYEDKFTKFLGILAKLKLYNTHRDYFIIYQIYKILSHIYAFFEKGLLIKEDPQNIIFLPPTKIGTKNHQKLIQMITSSKEKFFYLDGWNFRNPIGLKKYHKKITYLLRPKKQIKNTVEHFLKPVKKKYNLVGVHIRQGEYKKRNFMGGAWYFSEEEVAKILRNYLKRERKNPQKVLFILCSDNPLNLSFFSGMNVKLGIGSMMEDLLTLSMCNIILGANSTFGSFAAYYGNIPFFIFDHKKKYVKADGENLFQNSKFS